MPSGDVDANAVCDNLKDVVVEAHFFNGKITDIELLEDGIIIDDMIGGE